MDPALLLIIVFIVAPLTERLLKAGKGTELPPEPRPQQRIPPQQRMPQPRPQSRLPQQRDERAGRGDDAAAEMLPDDLWEILTGERRVPRAPEPAPELEAEDVGETYPVEAFPDEAQSLEEAALEQPSPRGWRSNLPQERETGISLESYERPLPEREAPRVVSLEQLSFDSEKRHDRFHKRLETLKPAAKVRRPAPSAYRFTNDEEVRRAIVMSEILGPPKGLE